MDSNRVCTHMKENNNGGSKEDDYKSRSELREMILVEFTDGNDGIHLITVSKSHNLNHTL